MKEEVYYAIKIDSLQIRHKGDDATVISSAKGSGCPGVAREHNLQESIGDIAVCTDFKILEIKVPIIFSGT